MVNISTLYVDRKAKVIRLIASVGNESYYENVYITGVKIDTQDTFTNGTPSSEVVYSRNIQNQKSIDLTISYADLDILNFDNLYFVYVITNDGYAYNTPCGLDNYITVDATADFTMYLNAVLGHVSKLKDCCELPRDFICGLLQYAAFKLAIKCGDFNKAIYYYNTYLKPGKGVTIPSTSGCGCHG